MRLLLFIFLAIPTFLAAQKLPTVEEKVANSMFYKGFFNFYWDEAAGKIWLDVNKLDSEFLYVVSLPAGLGSNDIGLDRGLLGGSKIVKFKKVGRKILLVQPNYSFRAETDNAFEKRAVEQSFAQSTLWGFTVEAESNGKYLVDATDFLLRDAMQAATTLRNAKQGNFIFDKNRSALYLERTKSFPNNTEFEASITLVNTDGQTGNFLPGVTPSTDAITLRMHHSFVRLPDNNFKKRAFDPRSGFFGISYFDYSAPVSEPINKSFIVKHRLQKKDPLAPRSEAVEPIIYYLDNGTPEPIRSALLEGASWWNQAFEAAGFINAFQVKVLPDTADPMDVRYNVINWVHRSTRGWSYGASVVDPRTGEIIKGHVTLGSLRVRQDYLIAQGLLAPFEHGTPTDDKMLAMALDRLKQLSAHEVGHTLGLAHNYAASVSNNASVMDYPHPQVSFDAQENISLKNAYSKGIGEWDKASISYGYSEFAPGVNEQAALNKILADAQIKGLQFIADRDAGSPGGFHASAHLWDNGTSATNELKHVMKIREKALQQFGEKNIKTGTPMAQLEDVLVPIYLFHRYQVIAATKLIGGADYTYAVRGDGQLIQKDLPKQEQLLALNTVLDAIDPKFLALPERILQLIPPRPPGVGGGRELFRKRTGLSFDALSPAETAVDLPVSYLFNTERMNRLSQNLVAGKSISLEEMVKAVIEKTWKAPRRSGMEGLIQMQTEQIILSYLLARSIDDNASFATRSVLHVTLSGLKTFINTQKKTARSQYDGHLTLALERMKEPEKAKPTLHIEMPPGAPIGCDDELFE